ncbi:MAG: hypothetical protein R3B96_12590 [Pirellulaceae bacterium]
MGCPTAKDLGQSPGHRRLRLYPSWSSSIPKCRRPSLAPLAGERGEPRLAPVEAARWCRYLRSLAPKSSRRPRGARNFTGTMKETYCETVGPSSTEVLTKDPPQYDLGQGQGAGAPPMTAMAERIMPLDDSRRRAREATDEPPEERDTLIAAGASRSSNSNFGTEGPSSKSSGSSDELDAPGSSMTTSNGGNASNAAESSKCSPHRGHSTVA